MSGARVGGTVVGAKVTVTVAETAGGVGVILDVGENVSVELGSVPGVLEAVRVGEALALLTGVAVRVGVAEALEVEVAV